MTYAASTTVPVERSRNDIEKTLVRYGATQFAYGWDDSGMAAVSFRAQGRSIRFLLPLPNPMERRFTHHARGPRTVAASQAQWEQACRARWRALHLVIKAKLEAVESGIVTFDDEFLAHIALPSGQTVGQWMGTQVELVYAQGGMPQLLPGLPAAGGNHTDSFKSPGELTS